MPGLGRDAEAGPVLGVQRPAHARDADPVAHLLQRVVVQGEAARHAGLLQQAEHRAGRKTRARQCQQGQQGLGAGVDAAAGAARHGVGDGAVLGRGTEHRVDQGRGGLQVGGDDQHLRGLQAWLAKQPQQVVLQHLELAGQRVADMQRQAAVIGGERHRAGLQIAQVQDGVLHLGQQSVSRSGFEVAVILGRLTAVIDQQVDMRLGLLAPGRQQSVALLMALGLAARGEVAQAAAVDQLEPVLAAGVEHIEVQVGHAADLLEQLDVQRRHGRQHEDMGAGRQAGGLRGLRRQRLQRFIEPAVLVVLAKLSADALP